MNNADLIELLNDLAQEDLSEGAEIEDHPASLAAAEITRLEGVLRAIQNAERRTIDPCYVEFIEQALYPAQPTREDQAAELKTALHEVIASHPSDSLVKGKGFMYLGDELTPVSRNIVRKIQGFPALPDNTNSEGD